MYCSATRSVQKWPWVPLRVAWTTSQLGRGLFYPEFIKAQLLLSLENPYMLGGWLYQTTTL